MPSSDTDARRPRVRLRRRPAWLLAGVLAVCLGGLASAYLVMNVAHTDEVLAVSHTVFRGETIEASDLTVVAIGAADGLSTVPSADVDEVVGQTALVDLSKGALVVAGTYGPNPLPDGRVRVGARLAAGRYPTGLVAGSTVGVVALPSDDGAGVAEALPATVPATLASAPIGQADGTVVVNLELAEPEAEAVSRLASADRVALVEQGSAP